MRASPPNPNLSTSNNFMNPSSMASTSSYGGMGVSGFGSGQSSHSMGGTSSAGNSSGGTNNVNSSCAMDITARLESLCLSMTEAALGSAFNI